MLGLAVLGCHLKQLNCDWLSTLLHLEELLQVRHLFIATIPIFNCAIFSIKQIANFFIVMLFINRVLFIFIFLDKRRRIVYML